MQRLSSCGQRGADCRRIDEGARNACGGVELRGAEGGAIRDRRGRGPSDCWDQLVHGQSHRAGRSGVIGGVGRRECDAERIATRDRSGPCGGRVDKGPCDAGCGIELRGAERGAVCDRRGRGPGNHGRALNYGAHERDGLRAARIAIGDVQLTGVRAGADGRGREAHIDRAGGIGGKRGGAIIGLREFGSVCAGEGDGDPSDRRAVRIREGHRLRRAEHADGLVGERKSRRQSRGGQIRRAGQRD